MADTTLHYQVIDEQVDCPIAADLLENESNIKRELRRLKRNLSMCKICTAQHGACKRQNSVTADLKKSLETALSEMGLSGDEWSRNKGR